ncbi:MAG TPA: hypothetical protein VH165_10085 [Kofleriaceae bacterium]|nr:hypothetical protein [Kofleriaceae bacterium]
MTARATHLVLAAAVMMAACGDKPPAVPPRTDVAPSTPIDKLLAMLPAGAQVVVELDLARLRANPVVGAVVTRALAVDDALGDALIGSHDPAERGREGPLLINQVVLAAYGVGTAQAATLTVMAAARAPAGATKIMDGFYAVGPPDWVELVEQRVALASTGEVKFAIRAAPELLELRDHAMPPNAPGASLRVTARLPFDARVALARQTGLDAAPAQLSAWADVADDLALVVDCDAEDPGNRPEPGKHSDAAKRLEATLRGALAAVADQPAARALGLPSSLAGAKLVTRGTWVRAIVAIGPAHLQRVVDRAAALLGTIAPDGPAAKPAPPTSPTAGATLADPAQPAHPAHSLGAPASPGPAPASAAAPRGDHAS